MRVQTSPFGAFASRNAGYATKRILRSESYLQPQGLNARSTLFRRLSLCITHSDLLLMCCVT